MSRIVFAVVAVALLAITPAQARPRHHHHHAQAERSVLDVLLPGSPAWLSEARRYLGTNPTGWARQWCAVFANMVLQRTGHAGSGSAAAISFARYGRPSGPQPGAVAVFRHHVGFVVADLGSHVRVLSGNHRRRVGVGDYPKGMVIAYRWP